MLASGPPPPPAPKKKTTNSASSGSPAVLGMVNCARRNRLLVSFFFHASGTVNLIGPAVTACVLAGSSAPARGKPLAAIADQTMILNASQGRTRMGSLLL